MIELLSSAIFLAQAITPPVKKGEFYNEQISATLEVKNTLESTTEFGIKAYNVRQQKGKDLSNQELLDSGFISDWLEGKTGIEVGEVEIQEVDVFPNRLTLQPSQTNPISVNIPIAKTDKGGAIYLCITTEKTYDTNSLGDLLGVQPSKNDTIKEEIQTTFKNCSFIYGFRGNNGLLWGE